MTAMQLLCVVCALPSDAPCVQFCGQGPIAGTAMRRAIQGMLEELEPNLWEHVLSRVVDYGESLQSCRPWASCMHEGLSLLALTVHSGRTDVPCALRRPHLQPRGTSYSLTQPCSAAFRRCHHSLAELCALSWEAVAVSPIQHIFCSQLLCISFSSCDAPGCSKHCVCGCCAQIEMAALVSGDELLHGEAVTIDMALTTEV